MCPARPLNFSQRVQTVRVTSVPVALRTMDLDARRSFIRVWGHDEINIVLRDVLTAAFAVEWRTCLDTFHLVSVWRNVETAEAIADTLFVPPYVGDLLTVPLAQG